MDARRILTLLLPLAACSPADDSPREELDAPIPDSVSSGSLEAWQVRIEDADAPDAAGLSVLVEDGRLRATTGADGVAWRPTDQVLGGDFSVAATFARQGGDAEADAAAGLVLGGRNLTDPDRAYTVFAVQADGAYRIVRRVGDETEVLAEGPADPEDSATGAHQLEARVADGSVSFLLDGREVATLPADRVEPHGVQGIHVGAGLEVEVTGWSVSPPAGASASGSPS